MDYSLNGEDIYNALGGNCKILSYKKLSEYKNIDNLLSNGPVIILYETTKNYGHWCSIWMNKKKSIEFFDPYGIIPDLELKYSSKVFRKQNGTDFPHLTALFIICTYNIEYNNYKLQKMDKNISTCGRWNINRILNKNKSVDEYAKYILDLCKKYKLKKDDLIVKLTENLIK